MSAPSSAWPRKKAGLSRSSPPVRGHLHRQQCFGKTDWPPGALHAPQTRPTPLSQSWCRHRRPSHLQHHQQARPRDRRQLRSQRGERGHWTGRPRCRPAVRQLRLRRPLALPKKRGVPPRRRGCRAYRSRKIRTPPARIWRKSPSNFPLGIRPPRTSRDSSEEECDFLKNPGPRNSSDGKLSQTAPCCPIPGTAQHSRPPPSMSPRASVPATFDLLNLSCLRLSPRNGHTPQHLPRVLSSPCLLFLRGNPLLPVC